ncbi:MAG: DUF4253 domain-containing protein [Acutalibacteraceae bacterium]|nr:DUF4253 domain-containing protein [Acutalibacteraceae bacterium]
MGLLDSFELTYEQANSISKSIIDKLGFKYRIFSSKADYECVMKAYEEAFLQGQKEGFTPVLVPADGTLEDFIGILENDGYSLQDVLNSELDSGEELLKTRYDEYIDDYIEDYESDIDEFIGEYDEEPIVITKYTAFRGEEVLLLYVPTTKPWELVAYVPFGGWNECPDVEEMTAICKYWYEKYGAVPVTVSHDVMEMRVPEPIKKEDALEVAKEHYAFTPDRVDQCTATGTLSEVAECLAVSKIWFFWWD